MCHVLWYHEQEEEGFGGAGLEGLGARALIMINEPAAADSAR